LVDAEAITRILKPEFDAASDAFNADEICKGYESHMLNYA